MFDSIKKGVSNAWDETGGKVVSAIGDHFSENWRDYTNAAITVGGFAAAGFCAASVVCGVAVGVTVGAATYTVSNAGTGNWNWTKAGIQTVGTGVGGGVGAKYLGPTVQSVVSGLRTRVAFWKLERNLTKIKRDIYGD